MTLIKTIYLKYKLRNTRTLEGYIDFVEKTDLSEIPKLTECMDKALDGSELKETSLENMFIHLNSFDTLIKKYNLKTIADCDDDFKNVIKLMQWLTDNTYYSGAQFDFLPDDTLEILSFSFKKGFKKAINCRYKAIALTDILVAVGIDALPICLVDKNKSGCHFIVGVCLKEKGKWIAVDPSFNTYFMDDDDNILDVFELRNYFLNNKTPKIVGYTFNGTDRCFGIYCDVFIKSCLANISTWQNNSENSRHAKNQKEQKDLITGCRNFNAFMIYRFN